MVYILTTNLSLPTNKIEKPQFAKLIYHSAETKLKTQIYITIKIKNLKILQHFWAMESIINRTENFVIYTMIIAKGQLS